MKSINDSEDYQAKMDRRNNIEKELGLRAKDGTWLGPRPPADIETWSEWKKALYWAAGGPAYEIATNLINSGKYEEYLLVMKDWSAYQEKKTQLAKKAIEETLKVYGIDPPLVSGPILSGAPCHKLADGTPDPAYFECYIGKEATWNPVFSENIPKGRWGETLPDGHVVIGADAFDYPGRLAYTLYHEGVHFQDSLTPDKDLRNDPAIELDHRREHQGRLKETFGLRDKDVEAFDLKMEGLQRNAKLWDTAIKMGHDPYKRETRDTVFHDDYKPRWLEQGELDEVRTVLNKAGELQTGIERSAAKERVFDETGFMANEVCSPSAYGRDLITEERLAPLRGRGADFYREILAGIRPRVSTDGCSFDLWVETLQRLANRGEVTAEWMNLGLQRYDDWKREQAEREADAATDKLAATYGFVWDGVDRGGWHAFRKADAKPPEVQIHFRLKRLDQAHAALFLVRTCLDRKIAEPSAEALDILNRRIGDPDFRGALAMRYPSGDVGWCYVYYMLENYGHLRDARGINDLLALMAEMRRRSQGGSRAPRDSTRRKDDADRDSRRQEKPDTGIDLTPAKEALERAKRKVP
jgi:hypothetical protein